MSHTSIVVLALTIVTFIAAIPIFGNVSKNVGELPARTPVNIPTALKEAQEIEQTIATNSKNIPSSKTMHTYLVAIGDNGKYGKKFGCNDSLIPYAATDSAGLSLKQRLQKLMNTKQQYYFGTKLYNALYGSDLIISEIRHSNDDEVIVHLSGALKLDSMVLLI